MICASGDVITFDVSFKKPGGILSKPTASTILLTDNFYRSTILLRWGSKESAFNEVIKFLYSA